MVQMFLGGLIVLVIATIWIKQLQQSNLHFSAGVLTFVSSNTENLQTTSQIELSGDFTIGIKAKPTIAAAGTFLADNTTTKELFKYESATRIKVKIDSANVNLDFRFR